MYQDLPPRGKTYKPSLLRKPAPNLFRLCFLLVFDFLLLFQNSFLNVNDHFTTILAAIGTGMMAKMRLTAILANGKSGRVQSKMASAIAGVASCASHSYYHIAKEYTVLRVFWQVVVELPI